MENENGSKRGIGILGGTFDPIHLGHLYIAEAVREELSLKEIVFIPTGMPPHKLQLKVTDSFHRLKMAQIATNSNNYFSVTDIEINRQGPSFTIDTMSLLQKAYPSRTRLYFITGEDAFLTFEDWKCYQTLLSTISFVIVTRLGNRDNELNNKINNFKELYNADITWLSIPSLEISSTDIRRRVKEGKSIKYLVSEGVELYIEKKGLYRD
ncbi:nicotinate-nucleotide adenylyltransferase [Alkaliphilus peptidifermentans]|uniref:Probable nicotinate-nucleotide adenylyltransferase n=1 Tax=Alkaliphilus peptidifermentans DSM 18978 TaxID=1120976 RepID=A0A1G5J8J0_9FIRM|nr:nicotinate-nucleotide adenylyltransferase [Alkaliphilus peptidifermentans]SCY84261.1 nicotinate-nucleotide adenylyltransferase [Alkaliphilus peptidifermentans DSM 18978]